MTICDELRQAVLQAAIQGKLTEQREEDGTAEELLITIDNSTVLDIDGRRVKKKIIADLQENQTGFDIPNNWKWIRLGVVCTIARGGSPRPIKEYLTDSEEGINWIKISDTDKGGKYIEKAAEKIIPEGVAKSRFVHKGDFLLTNSMSFGRPYILKIDGCIHDGWLVISQSETIFVPDFLYLLLSSQYAYLQFCDSVSGAVVKNLNSNKVANATFPLPPLAEQHRIVERVNTLMKKIDALQTIEDELQSLKQVFPGKMRDAILQAAMQGKLTEQLECDGTAEELLEEIRKEKERLIKEGKIKREKALSEISEDEIPFDIPENWKWVRVKELFYKIDTGKSRKCNEMPPVGNQPGIIKVSAVTWGVFQENESKACLSDDDWNQEYEIKEKDFLITRANTKQLVGACVIVDSITKRLMLSDKTLRIKFSKSVCEKYLLYCLRSTYVRIQIEARATGTSDSMKNISQNAIGELVVALPPLNEQRRIVSRIEDVIPLVKECV